MALNASRFTLAAFLALASAVLCHASDERLVYEARKLGLCVGEMVLSLASSSNAVSVKAVAVRSKSAGRLFSSVDTEVRCVSSGAGADRVSEVTKRVDEGGFHQNDILRLWPGRGVAVWLDAESGVATTSRVDVGVQDFASFFCDMGALVRLLESTARHSPDSDHGDGAVSKHTGMDGDIVRKVVMDGMEHEVAFTPGAVVAFPTRWGRVGAREFGIVSRSETLFSRNVPRYAVVATNAPVLLALDVRNSFGRVCFRLVEWTRDGMAVSP